MLNNRVCLLRLFAFMALFLPAVVAVAQPLKVIVSPVDQVRLGDPIQALGTLRANESANLSVVITDTVSAIHFEDGQRVSAGDLLVELSNSEQRADQAEAAADVEEARRQYERARDLADRGTVSASVLDQRERELQTARARLNAAEARLENRVIKAPFDGVLGLRQVSVGALLSPGTVVTTIHDDSRMKLDFSVPELFLAQVREGLEVQASSRAFPNQTFSGEILSIATEVDPVTRAFQVRAVLPNSERKLRPGMLMTVRLQSRERDAMVVPEEAVISEGRQHRVFVAEDNGESVTVTRRDIRIGTRRPGQVEVLDGVEAGERVVTHGAFRLSDGDEVIVRAVDDGRQPMSAILSNSADGSTDE